MAQRFKAKTLISNSGVFNNELTAPNLVYNTGNQNISGVKNFYSRPTINGTGILISGEAGQVDLSSTVRTTGDQTISGLKTFSNGVISSVGVTGVNLVYNTGDQNIFGVKTFSQPIYIATGVGSVGSIYGTYALGSDSHLKIIGINQNGDEAYVDIEAAGNSIVLGEGTFNITNNNGALNFNSPNGEHIYINGTRNLYADNITASFKNISAQTGDFQRLYASNLVYNTGNQSISGQKSFPDEVTLYGGARFSNAGAIFYNVTAGDVDIDLLNRPYSNTRLSIGQDTGILGESINSINNLREIKIWETGGYFTQFSLGPFIRIGATGTIISEQEGAKLGVGTKFPTEKVHISGGNLRIEDNLLVSGTGIFRNRPTVNGTGILLSGEAGQVDLSSTVRTTGDQTISGDKIFKNKIQIGDSQNAIYTDSDNNLIVSGYQSSLRTLKLIASSPSYETYISFGPGSDGLTFKSPDYFFSDKRPEVRTVSPFSSRPVALLDEVVLNTGNQIISGLKTFSEGILVTGGSINLIGKHSIGVGYQTGESIILRGGSGVSNGDVFTSRAKGGDIILIPGNAVSGGIAGNAQGNILLSGTSGAFPLSYVGMADDGGSARINIVGGVTNDDPRGGNIVIEGNLHINPSNSIGTRRGTRNFTIYKSGSTIAGDVNFRVTENSVIANSTIVANSGIIVTNSGIDLNNSQLINAVPQFINETANFIISGNDNGRIILGNSTSTITGTIVSGNVTGFNVSINQIGTGQIIITGSGANITINSYGGQYKTAGQYAAISLLHTGNNGYLMYGNTAL